MRRICLTGFDPVSSLGDKKNPSYELAKDFPRSYKGFEVLSFEVPTAFNRNRETVTKIIREYKPDIFLGIGLSGSRTEITLENIGINFRDAGYMKDNDGELIHHEHIFTDGAAAYITPLPVQAIVEAGQAEGLPFAESFYCGTYCCNQVLYTSLYLRSTERPDMLAGFLHVPYFPEMVSGKKTAPSVARVYSERALELVIEAAINML